MILSGADSSAFSAIRLANVMKSSLRATQKKYNALPGIKKNKVAYVTLAEGYTLNLFDQAGASQSQELQQTKADA